MMKGWKTWLAVGGMLLLGIADIVNDQTESGITKIVAAVGMLGIGHKIEKHG